MASLGIAEVAGLIALATAIIAFFGSNLIALLIAACVGHKRSAVTWSVVGRELQSSNWPLFLRADTTAASGIPLSISLLCWLQKLAFVLVTVAGIVTPFGLRSEIRLDSSPKLSTFLPVFDPGPMGKGTPPRDPEAFFNRMCLRSGEWVDLPATCPFSDTKVVYSYNGTTFAHWNVTYDIRMPYTTAEIFSSLHDEHKHTVSGAFDVQWRQYTYSTLTYPAANWNRSFQVGVFRPLDNILLDDMIEPVDGLVVDMRQGGVALRNHTAPTNVEIGGRWTEELLFVSPETACVDTNLTYDFQIAPIGDFDFDSHAANGIVNLSITDRGGFVNINQTYVDIDNYPGQRELELQLRAYRGAQINNAWSMFFFNISNPSIGMYAHAFNYLDSYIGKKFWLDPAHVTTASPSLFQMQQYGAYIDTDDYWSLGKFHRPNYTSSFDDPRTIYPNPFRFTQDNFSMPSLLCEGVGAGNQANISNVAVACGLMFGAATPVDAGSSLVYIPGTWWTQSIYSCATALKAEIKHVTFSWNASAEGSSLKKLQVEKIEDKVYESKANEPYWAVENLHRDVGATNPLWGLISSDNAKRYENNSNLNVTQSARLLLPGYVANDYLPAIGEPMGSNLATADAFVAGLSHLYWFDRTSETYSPYSGGSSLSLFRKWQELSSSVESASKIPNLIWTDLMANALVGTRSWLSHNGLPKDIQPKLSSAADPITRRDRTINLSVRGTQIPVFLYRNQVTYRWLYAILALLALGLLAVTLTFTLCLAATGKMIGARTLTFYLNWTSGGRLLAMLKDQNAHISTDDDTSYQHDTTDGDSASSTLKSSIALDNRVEHHIHIPSSQWVKTEGRQVINLEFTAEPHGQPTCSARTLHKGRYKAVTVNIPTGL